MSQESSAIDLVYDVHNTVFKALKLLSDDERRKVMTSVSTLLDIGSIEIQRGSARAGSQSRGDSIVAGDFSKNRDMSAKEFMLEKRPTSDVEKVACLAYYLTHYRELPEFKATEISQLNTEAAQQKLSNPSYAVGNAVKQGYLLATTKGQKQISAAGELYVQALPDRAAAKEAMEHARPRKTIKKRNRTSNGG